MICGSISICARTLCRTIKLGDRFDVRIPALADRRITVEVKLIATKGEYASWRATRATGDFDLRTFSIRAYPVDKVPELRPGMSAYLDWRNARMRRPKPGFFLVAAREWRWLLHDRAALDLDLRRAAVRVRRADRGLQPSGDPRAWGRRCRRGPIGDLAGASSSRWPRLRASASSSAPATSRRRRGQYAPATPLRAVYIPANFERDLKAARRPQVVAFYNQQYLTAAGVASSGLSDSLSAAVNRAVAPRCTKASAHRFARRGNHRAGQSAAELRAVPAAHAAAGGDPRGRRARGRLFGGLGVSAPQHAHLARLRRRQSDGRARWQACAAVRDLLLHHAVGAADPRRDCSGLRSRATCR